MVDHVTLRTADLEGAKAFFGTVLGLEAGHRPAFPLPTASRSCISFRAEAARSIGAARRSVTSPSASVTMRHVLRGAPTRALPPQPPYSFSNPFICRTLTYVQLSERPPSNYSHDE
jgi:catechol 2,3-dioxygenase-like lactoylglutathione lyase family enzyme